MPIPGCSRTILGPDDAIISDALNHASIIDGVRLCKAHRFRYANSDMADLEAQLQAADAAGARFKLIATDGVFSMDGYIAKLREICDLADSYEAMVMVDDSHAVGFVGATGRGTPEHCGVMNRVDIITGTLGKALGGASGRLHQRKKRDDRLVAPALATLSVFEHAGAGHCRHVIEGVGYTRGLERKARPADGSRGALPCAYG